MQLRESAIVCSDLESCNLLADRTDTRLYAEVERQTNKHLFDVDGNLNSARLSSLQYSKRSRGLYLAGMRNIPSYQQVEGTIDALEEAGATRATPEDRLRLRLAPYRAYKIEFSPDFAPELAQHFTRIAKASMQYAKTIERATDVPTNRHELFRLWIRSRFSEDLYGAMQYAEVAEWADKTKNKALRLAEAYNFSLPSSNGVENT